MRRLLTDGRNANSWRRGGIRLAISVSIFDGNSDPFQKVHPGIVGSAINELLDALMRDAEHLGCFAHSQVGIEQRARRTTPRKSRLGAGDAFHNPGVAEQLDHLVEFRGQLDKHAHVDSGWINFEKIADEIARHLVNRGEAPSLADAQHVARQSGGHFDGPPVSGTGSDHVIGGAHSSFISA